MSKGAFSVTPSDDRTNHSEPGLSAQNELIDDLNILLEAERAGTRVAISSAKDTASADLKKFLASLKHDEAHWCDMLTRNIEKVNGTPSLRCGDFYDKAMAIDDILERLDFLNRGQAWVVRKLDDLIARVENTELRSDLQLMHDNHRASIAETTRILQAAK
ncbi:DUF6306 domain-containing protein [Paremcibacter congregatus]|uniref:DUF6306 domain-containing protein n=1 Tax=Paremcibacter congregatus TaxID=2043170 RepID=UPI003A925108